MSSILKALKKLEEEQSGRSAAAGSSSGQFVAPTRTGQPLLLLILGVGAGLLLAGGGYVLFGRSAMQSAPPVPQEQQATVAQGQAVPVTTPVVKTLTSPPAAPVKTMSRPAPVAAPVQTVKSTPTPVATAIAPVVVAKPQAVSVAPVPAVAATATKSQGDPVENVQVERREIPAPGQQWVAPRLMVSDILPTSAGGRMAIVNGMPVMEGTMVDDVLVEKIGEDQVVFVVEGKTVMVPMVRPTP